MMESPVIVRQGRTRRLDPLIEASTETFPLPRLRSFLVAYCLFLALNLWFYSNRSQAGTMAWYTSIVWTMPVLISVIGLAGAVATRRRIGLAARAEGRPAVPVPTLLIVAVPTIARADTQPALERVVASFCTHLGPLFPRLRVDLIVDEGCEAGDAVQALADQWLAVRVVEVPGCYRTPNGTRFKARAAEYANRLRASEGEARDDVWVLHMDDDTGVGPDTATELARFITEQRDAGPGALHLGQGVLSYPREQALNWFTWMADSVRPGCDMSLFAASTGSGTPRVGLHGELMLVRASIEASIGWDFGPRAIVEDAQFALHFCERHPGHSGWFPALSYGASPASVGDLLRQRERWAWGLAELITSGAIPLRRRLLLTHNVIVWAGAPLGHPLVVLVLALALGDPNTNPVTVVLLPVWAMNVAFCVWLYWEGWRVNHLASSQPALRWAERAWLAALIPVFTLCEAVGIVRGLLRFARHGESSFAVIRKPA